MGNEVDEVKSRIDLVDLVSQYVALKKAGTNYKGVCPFHTEKTPSLMVSPQKQIWKCFGCNLGGSVFDFIMRIEGLEFGDALRLLADRAGVKLQPKTKTEFQTQNRKQLLYRINNLASLVFQRFLVERPEGQAALNYLKQRGLTNETIKKFRLGFAPKSFNLTQVMARHNVTAGDLRTAGSPEKFFERIMFPIFDVLGNVIAFTGRTLGEAQPKYLNSPETPTYNKSRVLYGLNFARLGIKDKNYVVLVEGQMDVIALHQAGADNAVASSGTAITEAQLLILSKYTDNFLIAFDNDTAGIQTTQKVIELLIKNDLNVKVADFSPYKDAGELLEKEPNGWPKRVAAALEGVDWLLQAHIKRLGEPRFVENKKTILKTMLPILSLVKEPTRLDHYVQNVSRVLETKPENIYASLKRSVDLSSGAPQQTTVKAQASQNQKPNGVEGIVLTPEEQLLAILIDKPALAAEYRQQVEEVVWQSAAADRIATAVKNCYNNKTLLANPSQFLAKVKENLNASADDKISSNPQKPSLVEKVDAWLFWLGNTWPELTDNLAANLVSEKIGQLTTKNYEQQKERLATAIRQAELAGNRAEVKNLMTELNKLTQQ